MAESSNEQTTLKLSIIVGTTETIEVLPNEQSVVRKTLQGEDVMTLGFTLGAFREFPVGASVEHDDTTYTMNIPASVKKIHSQYYEYTLTLESPQAQLAKYKFKDLLPGDGEKLEFFYTARPREHLEMLLRNLQRRDPNGRWRIGDDCIDAPEALISYSYTDCLSALRTIADTFHTEWEIVGKTIHLRKVEYDKDTPLELSYGRGAGFLTGVSRTSQTPPTDILYVQGGERNITTQNYNSKKLHLPTSSWIYYDGTHFEDEDGYDANKGARYHTSGDGLYVYNYNHNMGPTSVEESIDLTNIYPKRKGTISSVVVKNAPGHLVDIVDSEIPNELNYNSYNNIPGQKMTIIFEDGMLVGKEFDCIYQHTGRKFLIVPQEIDGIMMPDTVGNSGYMPAVGNQYSIYGINTPYTYICNNSNKSGAEWEMMREAVRYLYEHEEQTFTFAGELDPIFVKQNWETVRGYMRCGKYIRFQDEHMGEAVDIRVTGVTHNLAQPYAIKLELSNETRQYLPAWMARKEQQRGKDIATIDGKIIEITKKPMDKNPHWVVTSVDCQKDHNENTGYARIIQHDFNPLSQSYLQPRISNSEYAGDLCPIPNLSERTDMELTVTVTPGSTYAGFDFVWNYYAGSGIIDWGDGSETQLNTIPLNAGFTSHISHEYPIPQPNPADPYSTPQERYHIRLIGAQRLTSIRISQQEEETYRLEGLSSATITSMVHFARDVKGMVYDGVIYCPMCTDYSYAFAFSGSQLDAPGFTENFVLRSDFEHSRVILYNAFTIDNPNTACTSYLSNIKFELRGRCDLEECFEGTFKFIGDTSTNGSGVQWINNFLSSNSIYATTKCFANCGRLYDFADIPTSWK